MQFEITNRFTGEVQVTAEIDCDENAGHSVKLGLAVKWAYGNSANLRGADLRGADLRGADLRDADLRGADLEGANLRGADLRGADLRDADLRGAYLGGAYLGDANLRGADLRDADLRDADLRDANLWDANLGDANLRGADLRGADLEDADLRDANLRGADLRDAKNLNKHAVTPLLMLLDQPGKIRAYKLVNGGGEGPIKGGLKYEVGQSTSVDNANCDEFAQCAAGINVATADWCIREWAPGNRILIVEFEAKDIACIPTATDGKFRLHRCDVVAEADLTRFGLGDAAEKVDEQIERDDGSAA